MEGVLQNLKNVIVYIDNLLVHSDTHNKHLQILAQVLNQLRENHLKINLEKCIFGNKEVSYLGFTLTPEGITPGKNKLKAIQHAKAPMTSRRSDLLWGYATSSGCTSRTLLLSPPHCSNLPRKIPATKEAHCPNQPWMHSSIFRNS
jgi:hypothetical protein